MNQSARGKTGTFFLLLFLLQGTRNCAKIRFVRDEKNLINLFLLCMGRIKSIWDYSRPMEVANAR